MEVPGSVSGGTFAAVGVDAIRGERRLLSGLGFTLAPGAALVLTGPNGSGKSSLLRLMAGFGRPARGCFTWNGADIARDLDAQRARVQYVGHQDGLKPALTVAETLLFWAALAGHGGIDGLAALGAFGLAAVAGMPCRFLSSGQRRRLALSRLAAWPAPLWLLDEPAVGLDTAAAEALASVIRRHRRAGGSVVLATHQALDIEPALTLSLVDFAPPRAREAALAALAW